MEPFTLAIDPALAYRFLLHLVVGFVVCVLVIAAVFIDLADGVHTARRTGQKIHSHRLRVTGQKIAEYLRFVLIVFLVDLVGCLFSFYALPYLAMIMGAGLIGVEVKSLWEHARKRQSHALDVADIYRMIIDCAKEGDAKAALAKIQDYLAQATSDK